MDRKEAIEVVKKNWPDSSRTMLREALETLIPELKESEEEKIRKTLVPIIKRYIGYVREESCEPHVKDFFIKEAEEAIAWLEKQGERKMPAMIQWKGDNLKEVIDFTGVYKEGFEKWFHNSFEELEKYVHEHNNIFKIFNEDGSHIEVPVGAWIVKTPDGYNIASRYAFRQKANEWSKDDERLRKTTICFLKDFAKQGYENAVECIDWLEKQGMTNVEKLYYIIEKLWNILDNIDTYAELQISDTDKSNPFREIENMTNTRFNYVRSDGYDLYIGDAKITNILKSHNQAVKEWSNSNKDTLDWIGNK